jgi:3-oxoacyl-[acyl-carrier protein] reductase
MHLAGISIYCGTKAAVTMLTKSMAVEFAPYKIRVNCVNPGFIDTVLVREIQPQFIEVIGKDVVPRSLVQEPTQATDAANAVLFLSSPLSAKTTGESLLVDSGISIH